MNVDYIQHTGDDLVVANAARVSFDKNSEWEFAPVGNEGKVLSSRDAKLIKYLAEHKHISPFNHTFITLRVKAPIFVARQLQKHEYMPWNEVSRRYVDDEPEFFIPDEWRGRADNVKQGSGDPISNQELWSDDYRDTITECFDHYKYMIRQGVAPEQARMVLPQSMYTEWYWSGTLAAWAKMYNLRIDPHSQKETQDIARMCGDIIAPLFPVAWRELTK